MAFSDLRGDSRRDPRRDLRMDLRMDPTGPRYKPESKPSATPLPIQSSLPTIADLATILRSVDTAATLVNVIDKALEPEHEERQALKDLRKGVENLKSDIVAYEVLLSSTEKDTGSSLVVQRFVMGCAHRANNSQISQTGRNGKP